MFQQDTMKATRRSVQYPGIGSCFYLPELIWLETIEALSFYGRFRSEGLVYWGGAVGAVGETYVSSLLKLNHQPQGGGVRPTSQEMRILLRRLRERDEKLVAQVHSHPFEAFHSYGDSQHATSYHPGFLSIVLPDYGVGVNTLHDCAIYEYRGSFEAMSPDEITRRFVICSMVVNLMPPILHAASKQTERDNLWSALSRKLRSIVFKKPSRGS